MAAYYLGLDQGTTNTKAVLIDEDGQIISVAEKRLGISSPRAGWIEQDAAEMAANCIALAREVARPGIAAFGICNQTETLVVWDRETGAPLMPAVGWQCRRSAEDAEAMRPHAAEIARLTGLDLDPSFTATKLRWLARERPLVSARLAEGSALWGTVDCWLAWTLTSAYVTDAGNASRTMLFDIHRCEWSAGLESLFGLSLAARPNAGDSARAFGRLKQEILGEAISLAAIMGDQQASLYGHGCQAPGGMKASYGTGAFVWLNTGNKPRLEGRNGCLATIAWKHGEPTYALEGFVMYAGALLEWLLKTLGLGTDPARIEELARSVPDSGGVTIVPAFQGLGSPWWDADAKASILGLTAATTQGHICRAALEAIAYQTRAILEAMGGAQTLSVDGGVTRSALFMDMLRDALPVPVVKARHEHLAGFGVAMMAKRFHEAAVIPAEAGTHRAAGKHQSAIPPLEPWVPASAEMTPVGLRGESYSRFLSAIAAFKR